MEKRTTSIHLSDPSVVESFMGPGIRLNYEPISDEARWAPQHLAEESILGTSPTAPGET